MEYLVQVVLVVRDLGVLGGGEVGEDPVRAEHQEEGLIGPGPVGAAGEAVDRLGGAGTGLGPGARQARREQGIDDQGAADGDGGGGRCLEDRVGEEQGRQVDRGDQHRDLQDGLQRILVAPAVGEHGAQRHDLAAVEARRRPVRARHAAAVHGRCHSRAKGARRTRAGPLLRHQVGHRAGRRKRAQAHRASLGREGMGPEIGCYRGRPTASLLEGLHGSPGGAWRGLLRRPYSHR